MDDRVLTVNHRADWADGTFHLPSQPTDGQYGVADTLYVFADRIGEVILWVYLAVVCLEVIILSME